MKEHVSGASTWRSARGRWWLLVGLAAGVAACASVLGIEELSTDTGPPGGTGGNNATAGSAGMGMGTAGSTAGTAGNTAGSLAGTGGQGGIADASTDTTGKDGQVGSDTSFPSDAPPDVKPPPCAHVHGGPMVDLGALCIDATEVTNADYADFVTAKTTVRGPGTDTAGQPATCAWKQSFVPPSAWPANATETKLPVVYVDWCDAYAYCAWAGKRLCGRIGGGALTPAKFADRLESQWMAACTSLGTSAVFPYGGSYDKNICNGGDRAVTGCYIAGCMLVPVGSLPDCHGFNAAANVFDMSGNVWEWEDSCSSAVSDGASPDAGVAGDACRLRGGSIYARGYELQCDSDLFEVRGQSLDNLGIRCCSP